MQKIIFQLLVKLDQLLDVKCPGSGWNAISRDTGMTLKSDSSRWCASSVQMLNQSLKCVFRELCSLRYPRKLFRQVLHDLSRRYVVLSDATRLSSTWEIEIGSEDWHLFQCTIVQTLFPLWKWFFTRLYRGDINTMSQPWKLGIQVILGFLVFTCSISIR